MVGWRDDFSKERLAFSLLIFYSRTVPTVGPAVDPNFSGTDLEGQGRRMEVKGGKFPFPPSFWTRRRHRRAKHEFALINRCS